MIQQTIASWNAEGVKRFGPDRRNWKFVCSGCGKIQSVEDFIRRGLEPHWAMKTCLTRHTSFSATCGWTIVPPLGTGDKGRFVIVTPETSIEVFDFAPAEREEHETDSK